MMSIGRPCVASDDLMLFEDALMRPTTNKSEPSTSPVYERKELTDRELLKYAASFRS